MHRKADPQTLTTDTNVAKIGPAWPEVQTARESGGSQGACSGAGHQAATAKLPSPCGWGQSHTRVQYSLTIRTENTKNRLRFLSSAFQSLFQRNNQNDLHKDVLCSLIYNRENWKCVIFTPNSWEILSKLYSIF